MIKPLFITLLVVIVATSATAADYEGKLIRKKSSDLICLVANGTRIGIPDMVTYRNLFGSASWIFVPDSVFDSLPLSPNGCFAIDSTLMKNSPGTEIFFALNTTSPCGGFAAQKILIQDTRTFNKYQFSASEVQSIDRRVLALIPTGGVLRARN